MTGGAGSGTGDTSAAPRFSVVTVVLNGAAVIEQTISSVLLQNRADVEYLVVDGGSRDGTLDVVDRYRERIARVVSEPDHGIYDAFNKGIALATGRYVLLLNAGDRLAPGALDAVAAIYERADGHEFVLCCAVDRLDAAGNRVETVRRGEPDLLRRHRYMFLNHPATFVPKAVYDRVGLYDATFRIAGDYEFAQRLLRDGVRIRFTDTVVTVMNAGGVSAEFSWTQAREFFRVVRAYGGTVTAAVGVSRFIIGTASRPLRRWARRTAAPR